MNASASWPEAEQARNRVLEIQTKLHRWAVEDRSKCFDDLFNLARLAHASIRGQERNLWPG